jgi:glutamate 5-kinase
MNRSDFNEKIREAKRIVIKVGSARVSGNKKKVNEFLFSLATDIKELLNQKKEIILVTSGAVAQGIRIVSEHHEKKFQKNSITERQALASIGQSHLMNLYEGIFSKVNLPISQILFGMNDIQVSSGAVNLKNTFEAVLNWNVLPIVNENDSVSIEELKFGDNDILSSMVALLLNADLLIILTGIDGFYKNKKLVSYMNEINEKDLSFAKGPQGPGTGGMNTKLKAAKILLEFNIPTAIIDGNIQSCISKLITENNLGTLISNQNKKKTIQANKISKLFQ